MPVACELSEQHLHVALDAQLQLVRVAARDLVDREAGAVQGLGLAGTVTVLAHRSQKSGLHPEWLWQLDADGLQYTVRGQTTRVPFAHVQVLRLAYDPTQDLRTRFACTVTCGDGSSCTIYSTHQTGLSAASDHRQTYVPLVQALIAGAAGQGRPRLLAGVSPLRYWLTLGGLLLLWLVAVLVLSRLPSDATHWVQFVGLALGLPVLAVWAKRNRPRSFVASAIPEGLLPSVTTPS